MGSPAGCIQLDLFQAAHAGDCARLARLLEGGANVNMYDRWDSPPLYYASHAGQAEAAKMLLEAGAVFAGRTFEGERCYRAALNLDIKRLLRSYEARTRPRPPPPPLKTFPAVLRLAFLVCPSNRACSAELWPVPPDITLYVQGRPIEAHRVILAARSPYFRTKLTKAWRNRKEVTFSSSHGMSFELMYGLVKFFYSNKVEVPADDMEALAQLCKACKCKGILHPVNRSMIARNRRYPDDAQTRQLDREHHPRRRFLLQARSMDLARDRLPSVLRGMLQDCLANSREEDLHNNEPVETCSAYVDDDLADVRIRVGDRVFRCHQLFLALRSDYFKTRLSRRTDFLERHCDGGELPLLEEHDVSAEAFEKMLEYVYTDELKDLGDDDDDDDPLLQAEELLDVASRYLLFGLKRVVTDLLLPHLDLDHVSSAQLCRWLVLSDMYDVAKLREHCLNIMACNLEAFSEVKELQALLPSDGHGDISNDLRQMFGCK